jgi:predicted GIY-YIG superfamily endonuclease
VSRYRVQRLVYLEEADDVNAAIVRDKQIKGLLRAKTIALVESLNRRWKGLSRKFR